MKVLRRISAIILGFVFFTAGTLKLMDPVGSGLVVEEYLKFLHLGFLRFAADWLAEGLALLETLLGAALITGVWKKVVGVVTLVMLAFFTVLTAVLWIANPVMDCGCFGEAIHLTHAQSFVKNLVLCAFWALAFIPLSAQEQTRKVRFGSFAVVAVFVVLFAFYSLLTMPLVEFTAFKAGSELVSVEDLSLEDEDPALLSFSNFNGEYADSLAFGTKTLIASVYDPERLLPRKWERLAEVFDEASELGYTPLLLLASSPDRVTDLVSDPGLLACSYFADQRTLMTLNRSNGGISYLSDGQILVKWSSNHFPDNSKLSELATLDINEALITENHSSDLKLQAYLLFVFAVMLLL